MAGYIAFADDRGAKLTVDEVDGLVEIVIEDGDGSAHASVLLAPHHVAVLALHLMTVADDPPHPMTVGQVVAGRVTDAMDRAGLDVARLAAEAGISVATLLRRLAGSPFALDELHAVSLVLGVPLRDLVAEPLHGVRGDGGA